MARQPVAEQLPDFPWDSIAADKARAMAYPDGFINLSVGTPIDPVAPVVQEALAADAWQPGYPQTRGTDALRAAIVGSLARRYHVEVTADAVLPTIGSKEAIAWLPTLLGLGDKDTVVIPELAYPTYEVGAKLAGSRVLRADGTAQIGPARVSLYFLNSPSNPTGKILGIAHLRKVVEWARQRGTIVAADECYLGLGWDDEAVSILDERVSDGDHTGLIAIHSLSKSSNLAGYRAGFLAGDPALIDELLQARRHAGMIVPTPVQSAMVAALDDDAHEQQQRDRYRVRREHLQAAVLDAGFEIENSVGGLYLWATRHEDGRKTVADLTDLGILVAPGDFYGPRGKEFVRIAMTATDAQIDEAGRRMLKLPK